MVKNTLFCIITSLLLSHNIVSIYLPIEYQYLFWMGTLLTSLTCISFLLLIEVSYKKYFKKFSSFLIFDISLYALIDFLVMRVAYHYDTAILKYLSVLFTLAATTVFLRSYFKHFMKERDQYERFGSFLVYKYPKSLWGILSSIYTAPYGHCFLLVDKNKFYYKRDGALVEELLSTNQIQKQKDVLFFKRIPDVELDEARKLVGKKWSVFNNCFSTFSRFK